MSALTTDPTDPRLGHGSDDKPKPQNEAYLVLSEEERAKGFVRPYRDTYFHDGLSPRYTTRELTPEERERYEGCGYVLFEQYPESMAPKTGRYWTAEQLTTKGCGTATKMTRELSETYARQPSFYGSTYCVHCGMHRPVAEFKWSADGETVGS